MSKVDPKLILIVDDEARMRRFMQMNLELEGYQVIEAGNGLEALDRVRDDLPDLVLLDVMMPEMDGFQFLDEFRRHDAWRTTPVIVITAKELTDEDRQRLNGYIERVLEKGAYSMEHLVQETCAAVDTQNPRANAEPRRAIDGQDPAG